MSSNRISLLCIVGLGILVTSNASSYLACSNAKDCKASMAHEFGFSYMQAQNHLTKEKLQILRNAAETYVKEESGNLGDLLTTVEHDIQALDTEALSDLKKSNEAADNAAKLWRRVFDLFGDMDNLQYYEKLIKHKIEFFHEIPGFWKSSTALMKVKTDEDEKEIANINEDAKKLGEISSLLGTETRMKAFVKRIATYLELQM